MTGTPNGDSKQEDVADKPLLLFPAKGNRPLSNQELLDKKPADLKIKLKKSIPYNRHVSVASCVFARCFPGLYLLTCDNTHLDTVTVSFLET